MAFPTGYTKYQEVTIDNTKVSADLTDFPVYVDLSDLDKVGSDIFDTCRTDGGDIRITKSDGTTELAREIVDIDTTAKTGELHFKFSGTLSSSSDTTVRIYYNGVDTEPASTATYGSEAVWSDYELVVHMEDGDDSSPNGLTPSASGPPTDTSGKLGRARSFSNDTYDYGDQSFLDPVDGEVTWTFWIKQAHSNEGGILSKRTAAEQSGNYTIRKHRNFSDGKMEFMMWGAGSGNVNSTGATNDNDWSKFTLTADDVNDEVKMYLEGSLDSTHTSWNREFADNGQAFLIGFDGQSEYVTAGVIDEVRIRNEVLDGDWEATEYNNQNSPSTFYSIGNEQGGGATSNIKSIAGITQANIKSMAGITSANIKSVAGVTNS